LTSTHDRHILRVLASQVAELAGLPVMSERRRLWKQHNRLQPTRPLILVFPEGSWEELYRGKSARRIPGSGLGLPLVRAIVARHGGQATLRSRAGQGTVVTLRLPV
jgi:hypothetical protein